MNTKTTLRELADALKEANKTSDMLIRVVFAPGGSVRIEERKREEPSSEWRKRATLREDIVARILGKLPGWKAWKRHHYGTVNDDQVPHTAYEIYAESPKRVRDAWAQEETQ